MLIDCGPCSFGPGTSTISSRWSATPTTARSGSCCGTAFRTRTPIEAGRAWLAAASAEDPPTALAIDVGGEAIGGIGVVLGADVNRHAGEIGYWLGRAWWGRGLATASVSHFVPWVAQTFGLARLFAQVFETNRASMRVLEKCGFQREGILRSHAHKDGRYLDEVVYGIVLGGLGQNPPPVSRLTQTPAQCRKKTPRRPSRDRPQDTKNLGTPEPRNPGALL